MAMIIAVRPGSQFSDLPGLLQGFALALPVGLCMTALARLVPGLSLLSGGGFIAIIVFAFALTQMLPDPSAHSPAIAGFALFGRCAPIVLAATRPIGRSR